VLGIALACLLPTFGVLTALSTFKSSQAVVVAAGAIPSQLGRSGGTVVVTGKVEDATTCQLKLLSKQPLPVVYSGSSRPCSSGFTAHVVIGPNHSALRRTITFALVARNKTSSYVRHFSVGLAGPPPPPTTTTAAPVPFDATAASQWPSSMFDSNVQSWPVDTNSAQYVSDFVSDYETDYGSVGVNTAPVYVVPANQPDVTVSVAPGCNNFISAMGNQIPIPASADLNGSSDSPLVIWQPSTHRDWELWKVSQQSPARYSACWGGKLNTTTSNGVFPSPYGLSATGISYLAVTVTEADIASGSIDHAVGITLPSCNYSVYPADRGDCRYDPGQPAEGQWFRFTPGTQMPPRLTPFGQMVFQAIETYGAVVTDQGGGVLIEAEQSSDWAAEGHSGIDPITASWEGLLEYQVVASLPWSDLQVVDPPN
jgi:hypothetical protein